VRTEKTKKIKRKKGEEKGVRVGGRLPPCAEGGWMPLSTSAKSCRFFYTSRVIAIFVSNFVAMATGVSQEKCDWQHSMAHPRKPTYRRKNFAAIFYTSRVIGNFVPNFVAIAKWSNGGKYK